MKPPYVDLVMYGRRQAAHLLSPRSGVVGRCLASVLALSLWLAVVTTAQATTAGSLDANYPGPTNGTLAANNRMMLAQTFMALSSGGIDQVSLTLGNNFGGGRIYVVPAAADGTPSTALPAQAAGGYSGFMNCCSFRDYPLSPRVPVVKGNKYAIVVAPNIGNVYWSYMAGTTTYTAGHLWLGSQPPSSWSYQASWGTTFAFKTYVVGSASINQPPTIIANSGSVSADEGAAPINTGTYADPDGDTVTLTTSTPTGPAGIVTTNAATGTWTWTGAALDEGQGQTITITADDGHGQQATAQFSTVIKRVLPVATIHGAPASGPEGTAITLTGSAISPSIEDNTKGFMYRWTATKNGVAFGPVGSGNTFTLTPDDEGAYVVDLYATDDGGFTSLPASASIIGANVPPTATFTSVTPTSLVMVSHELLTFYGSFSDPGIYDSHTVTWKFGDGATSTTTIPAGGPTTFSAPHEYESSGTYYAELIVADDDGGTSESGRTVIIQTPAQAMASIAAYMNGISTLNGGQKNSLQAKLNAASDAWQRGDSGAACNELGAFVHEVDADQTSGHLAGRDANALTAAARATQLSMGCFHTLVEFISGL